VYSRKLAQMQYTTSALLVTTFRILPARVHVLALFCFLGLAVLGCPPEASAGWIVWPPVVYARACFSAGRTWRCVRTGGSGRGSLRAAAWWYACCTWRVPVLRSLMLATCWWVSGQRGSGWVVLLPWAVWVWQGAGVLCRGVRGQPEWWLVRQVLGLGEQVLLWTYLGLALGEAVRELEQLWRCGRTGRGFLAGVPLLCAGPSVVVRRDAEQGGYLAELEGRFTLRVGDDDPFRLRLLVLFLRQLDAETAQRGSRRTRDGRTPFVRQEYLANVLGIPQPVLSRWEGYWRAADWRRLLSQMGSEVLTLDLQWQIIETWAHWPGWGIERVHRFLVEHGVTVTESQVRQAAQESGWQIVRQVLACLCVQRGEELRLREDWLVGDLLAQIQKLLEKVERRQGLSPEEQLDLAAWRAVGEEAGLQAQPPREAVPWLRRVEQVLFAPDAEVAAEGVCCPDCGSSHVGRKGRKARLKKFVDEQGQVQEVPVYRYRCYNSECPRESFTVFPPGLVPYSRQRFEVHVLALQMYAWGYSTYRRTGEALGIASMTAYRWVSAFGYRLLPVAALFGLVKSSGVCGVDEKWVQVPKNNKPAGDHRKWMYVYMAADAYTYDLLHIAIYPHNNSESARAFLLALRAKGYHPRVVVTDLRRDYGPAIAQVFPQAQHHECLFHAAQHWHAQLAKIYGWDALRQDPSVIALRRAFDETLQARTKRTAQRRYEQLMAQRDSWIKQQPELASVFASLEAHWPKLLNGIESDLIPTTNNTVELVIRRFDQHYQNFCGFDSLASAEQFLAVFERIYRFTPFSEDAQPRIRGRSPLQLAGYAVERLPMSAACNGWAITLPTQLPLQGVPSV